MRISSATAIAGCVSLSWMATLSGRALPVVVRAAEAGHDVGQRAAHQEVLLDEAKCLAGERGIVGIEDARDRLGEHPVHDRPDEIAGAEFAEVEEVGRGRSPQPQRVDRPTAITDDRTVVGHAEQMRRMAGNGAKHAILQLEGAAERHLDRFARPGHFPGIGLSQPVVRVLDLEAVLDRLPENAVFVAQAIAHRRNLQRGQRIDEAGREPAQAAVAQAGVRLRLDDFLPILPRVGLQVVADELLDAQG